MASAGWHIVHEGRKVWAATKAEARHIAQVLADHSGKRVKVHPATRPAAPKKTVKKTVRRNPMDLHIPAYHQAEQRAKTARAEYLKATMARRLAKGLRGQNRGGAVKRAEAGAKKTGKFVVKAVSSKDRYTLYRASRTAADALADQFRAAGYKTSVGEA